MYLICIKRPNHEFVLIRLHRNDAGELNSFSKAYMKVDASQFGELEDAKKIMEMLRDAKPGSGDPLIRMAYIFKRDVLQFQPWVLQKASFDAEGKYQVTTVTLEGERHLEGKSIQDATISLLDNKFKTVEVHPYSL